jgi:Tol biopolymer transport system component
MNKKYQHWDINLDGGKPRPVLPGWNGATLQTDSVTSPDGRWSVFSAGENTFDWDLWAFREKPSLFSFGERHPIRLTNGPGSANHPQFDPDGRRVYYLGTLRQPQLVRFDPEVKQWVPYLNGLSACQLSFSADGKWVTYVAAPGFSVWRARIDGTQRIQLTTPAVKAINPRWSPDGTKIVFFGNKPGQTAAMFLLNADGTNLRVLAPKGKPAEEQEPTWFPDSRRVLYALPNGTLHSIDVLSGAVQDFPDSEDLRFPRLSPDGRYAAAPDSRSQLWLYDMQTRKKTLLTSVGAGYPTWSSDGEHVYFENDACSMWFRVGIHDRRVEAVTSLAKLHMARAGLGWVGLAPDGSTISAAELGTSNIYAIDLEER